MSNELVKTNPATDADVVRFYTRLNTFFGVPGDEHQILLFATVILKQGVTVEQLAEIERRAYLDVEIAKAVRYKTPLFPAILLDLLNGSKLEHDSQKKRFTHADTVAYLHKNPGRSMDEVFEYKGSGIWTLKR